MACGYSGGRDAIVRLIPLLFLLVVSLSTFTSKQAAKATYASSCIFVVVLTLLVRSVGMGGRLRVQPRVRGNLRGGAVRPTGDGGEPRLQRRVPLQRMRRRPVRLPRLRSQHGPGVPLPALASYYSTC